MTTHRIFDLDIDRGTGEWLTEPVDSGDTMEWSEWCAQDDTDEMHYDHDSDGRLLRCWFC